MTRNKSILDIRCDASTAKKQLGQTVILSAHEMIEMLTYAGEQLLTIARTDHGYMNQTGNLTSSMGYIVTINGRIVRKNGFTPNKSTSTVGAQEGSAYAESLASQFRSGYALIVVAGMNYASYVENGHTARNGRFIGGRPVLATAKVKAPGVVSHITKVIQKKLQKQ